MYAIIVGGGDVGTELALNLLEKKHNVVVVDKDAGRVKDLAQKLDALIIHGNGANLDLLLKAKIKSAKMLIAVTESDETNIISCMIAKTFDVPITVARVRNPESAGSIDIDTRGLTQRQVGIDHIISPEKVVSQEMAKMIHFPESEEVEHFAKGYVKLVIAKVPENAEFAGKRVGRLPLPEGCAVVGIRQQRGELLLPAEETIIEAGDFIYLLGGIKAMREAGRVLYPEKTRINRVVILGGGMTGYYLASALEQTRQHSFFTKVIEKDYKQADELNRMLGKTIIIQGDGRDLSYFNEEELSEADVLVAVTGDDRTNIIAAIMGQKLGVRKIISEVRSIEYSPIYKVAGVDNTINPHLITASQILRFTHTEDVVSFSLLRGRAEVMERVLSKESKVVGKRISEANLPKGLIVGAILRDEKVFIPKPDSLLKEMDHLVIFSKPDVCSRLDRCFAETI